MSGSGKFDPKASGYVEVAERIAEFRGKYPDGALQAEVLRWPEADFPFVVVRAFAYRTADDDRPGIGHAQEPYPGRTPYTKDSELQNAETSAWGRAIVAALAGDTKRGIATAEEARNRDAEQAAAKPVRSRTRSTKKSEEGSDTSVEPPAPQGGTAGVEPAEPSPDPIPEKEVAADDPVDGNVASEGEAVGAAPSPSGDPKADLLAAFNASGLKESKVFLLARRAVGEHISKAPIADGQVSDDLSDEDAAALADAIRQEGAS